MSNPNPTVIQKNLNLDIVRIIGALMVLLVHTGYAFGEWVSKHTWYGFYGTTLFFVLSGYLVMHSCDRSDSALTFYKKRIVHIIPLYWSILLINYVIQVINHFPAYGFSIFGINGGCGPRYLRYFLFLNMFIPSDSFDLWNNMLGFWTMSGFFFFYLVTPLVHKVIRRYNVALIVMVLLLLFQKPFVAWETEFLPTIFPNMAEPDNFALMNPISNFYIYFLGVTLYFAHKESKQISYAALAVLAMIYRQFQWFAWDLSFALLILVAIECPSSFMTSKTADASNSGSSKLGMMFTKLVAKLSKKSDADFDLKEMSAKAISTFAEFSFALYLSHNITLSYVMRLQNILVPIIRNKGFLVFVLFVCIGVAYLIWRFIEKPLSNKLKAKIL